MKYLQLILSKIKLPWLRVNWQLIFTLTAPSVAINTEAFLAGFNFDTRGLVVFTIFLVSLGCTALSYGLYRSNMKYLPNK